MSMPDPSPDAFAMLANLLAVIGDPKAASQRLSALEKQIDAASKARERLEADHAAHERPDGESDMANLTWAKDGAMAIGLGSSTAARSTPRSSRYVG
jgi:hypothetical protein